MHCMSTADRVSNQPCDSVSLSETHLSLAPVFVILNSVKSYIEIVKLNIYTLHPDETDYA